MFRGFSKIFVFTFAQHVKSKGYKALTIVVSLLCLLLPITIMGLLASFDAEQRREEEIEQEWGDSEHEDFFQQYNPIHAVFVVDLTEGNQADFSILNTIGEEGYTEIVYETCESLDVAQEKAENMENSLIAVIEKNNTQYEVNILLPEMTNLTWEDALGYDSFLYSYFQVILVQKSGLDYTELLELMKPIQSEINTGEDSIEDGVGEETEEDLNYEMMRELFAMILPYMTIMILYFMILFYGQGVANSVIMEKTSKLMDQFLVTVKPSAMILGKLLGIAFAGALQLASWIVSIVIGFVGGTAIAKAIDPETNMAIIQFFETFGDLSGMFAPVEVVLCIIVIFAGFLMYCALASIGGAMAGKPEDLGTTNVLFTMALVFSFLITLNSGVMSQVNGSEASIAWQYYVPFTAIFIVPSEALLGNMTVFQTILSLGCILGTTVIIVALAGKIYSMLVLYKGNPPTLKNVFGMLRKK